jgi:oligosaccharide reducing-end xylanase
MQEGMSYGMVDAVMLDRPDIFDKLWRWVQLHMFHGDTTDPLYGYSDWHCRKNGQPLANGPAPGNARSARTTAPFVDAISGGNADGETFFIEALALAGKRWGNNGAYDYTHWANVIGHAIMSKELPPCGKNGCDGVCMMQCNAQSNIK